MRIDGVAVDLAGNSANVRVAANGLTIWNTAEITGIIHDSASSEPELQKFDVKPFMVSTSGVSGYSIS